MYDLKLYIVDETRKSMKPLSDLEAILEAELEGQYTLEVIDVLENPQKAIEDKVFATPTLVKLHPPPVKKIIGDMSTKERLLTELGVIEE